MSMITVNRFNDSITGAVNGKPFGVSYSDERFEKMKELELAAATAEDMDQLKVILEEFEGLTNEDYSEIVSHTEGGEFLFVNKHTGQFFLKLPKTNQISNVPIPQGLVTRIVESIEKKINPLPVIKAWVRMLRNPKFSMDKATRFVKYINTTYTSPELMAKLIENGLSEAVARERATSYQTPITLEGLICTYKVSREIIEKFVKDEDALGGVKEVDRYDYEVDEFTGLKTYKKPDFVEDRVFQPAVMGQGGDAFYCDDYLGHVIKVGAWHFLDSEDKVNSNDHAHCVPGLHCGNLDYIRSYQDDNTVTHYIFVDPMDIRAIPLQADGAIRTIRYFVERSFAGVNRSLYHSSKIAEVGDERFRKMVEEAVAVKAKAKVKDEIAELQQLL